MTERVRLVVSPVNEVQLVIVSENDTEHCSICFENTTRNDTQLSCGHMFHDRCLHEWLDDHTTCPVCRVILPILGTKSPHTTVDPEISDFTEALIRARTTLFELLYRRDVVLLLVVVQVALFSCAIYLIYRAWDNFR